jgi:RNA polymerase sigma-70 factor (ECF subfamily)
VGWIEHPDLRQAQSRSVDPLVRRPIHLVENASKPMFANDPPDDVALLRDVAAGDRVALATLYDRHSALVVAIGVRILRNRRDAEDIAHDVFLEVWRRAATYDPSKASVKTWLVLIMRCRALDRRKSAAVAMTTALVDDARATDAMDGPDAAIDRSRVAGALAALTPTQREVLSLGYFEGLSSSEIAERLSIPLGTVKSRVAGALRALRTQLGVATGGAGAEVASSEDPS